MALLQIMQSDMREVILLNEDKSKTKWYEFPGTTTIVQLKEKGTEDFSLSTEKVVIRNSNGDVLNDCQQLDEIAEVGQEGKIICLFIGEDENKGISKKESTYTLYIHIVPDSRLISLSVHPDDKLGRVISFLRSSRDLVSIKCITISGRSESLTAQPEWRKRTLTECDIQPCSKLEVECVDCPSVLVKVFSPLRRKPEEFPADICRWSYMNDIFNEVERRHPGAMKSALRRQVGFLYKTTTGHRYSINHYEKGIHGVLDEDNGQENLVQSRTHFVIDFLENQSISAAPASKSTCAVIEVYMDTKVYVFVKDQLLPADQALLFSLRAVLLFEALELNDNAERLVLILRVRNNRFVDVETGIVYDDRGKVANHWESKSGCWSRVWIVVMAGDVLPRYNLPKEESINLYFRYGVDIKLVDRHVTVPPGIPLNVSSSRWVQRCGDTELDIEKAVSAAIRLHPV